jgi:hypothetical protein
MSFSRSIAVADKARQADEYAVFGGGTNPPSADVRQKAHHHTSQLVAHLPDGQRED